MVYEFYGLRKNRCPRSHHSDGNAYVSLYGYNMCSNAGALEREKNSTFK